METDASKPNGDLGDELWAGLDNSAMASLYQQLGYDLTNDSLI